MSDNLVPQAVKNNKRFLDRVNDESIGDIDKRK